MATRDIPECGLSPLPRIYHRPRTGHTFDTIVPNRKKFFADYTHLKSLILRRYSFGERKRKVEESVPLRVASVDGEERENKENINGVASEDGEFDPGAPPPFKLGDIRAAIPKHCWIKDPWRSMSYVLRDVVVVFGLAALAVYLNNWVVWPLYWFAQGTMFWALFVLGHDCGHGSFSNNHKLNSVVGHLLHSSILVPYHGWRISHRTHHQNHGHVDNDESWHPLPEKIYNNMDVVSKKLRFTLPFPLFAYPVYLFFRSPGKLGSHFHPGSSLFVPSEANVIMTSTICCSAMAALLVCLSYVMGPLQLLKLYGIPYAIFVIWLDLVTYLHHHGHEEKLPWYRGKEWSYLRGGLTTLDRDYGWINNIHHNIGTRDSSSFPPNPTLPPYRSRGYLLTEAAKPILGKYYREPTKSRPLPLHLLDIFMRSMKHDHYVNDSDEFFGSPGKLGSHFHPGSSLFVPSEANAIMTSTICCSAMAALLVCLSCVMGPLQLLNLYGIPYAEWSHLRAGLTTLDRDYRWINNIHHNIGTHVIHHLFPQIPHYHLIEATEEAKPILGKYYREPTKSRPLPLHLLDILMRSMKRDQYVNDSGEVVYYETDQNLF
ncbi:hypothetical protein Nepgr_032398 [Nepenthes gracilis]|uniref:Omega-3 fatty acid desaturase n=1 Tax=Nepenthes gracilis TaxID=150966 RepID=A0AAD3Y7N0_NEPGR|nr:hypothetical protein Nepgr_032398 [Nepenthes gracilis]